MGERSARPEGFDGAAAVTRSLLGYGVLAGVVYLGVGVVLALTREGFDLSRHPLSLLMLGENGWMQRANIIVVGLMVLAAAVGFARAMRGSTSGPRAGVLLMVHGAGLVLSGVFPPDPLAGFPAGAPEEPSVSGILHLASGAVAFLAVAAAALVVGRWFGDQGLSRWAGISRWCAAVVLLAFVGGAALATQVVGVVLLWVAVLVGWAWLAGASTILYRIVPHPDPDRRAPTAA
jgi:hypothetical membrane protein